MQQMSLKHFDVLKYAVFAKFNSGQFLPLNSRTMRKSIIVVVACLSLIPSAWAQNYQTHSLFIYSFTRFVQWPEESRQGDFQISVLGDSPIADELKAMAEKKKASGRNISVSVIKDLSEFKKCHILFVSQNWSARFQDVAGKIGEEPVLIVTEQAGLGSKGSDVNFITKDGKLVFELNQTAMGKHKLKASAELTRLAILI
jgi:hypothetical protein